MIALERQTLPVLFKSALDQFPVEVALGFVDEKPLTYAQVEQRVTALIKAMKIRGIERGDRVAILSENSPDWCVAYIATTMMGAVSVPILPDFHKNEVHHILRNSGSKGLFIGSKLAHKVADMQLRDLEMIVSLDDQDLQLENADYENMADLILGKEPRRRKKEGKESDYSVGEDDLAEILYTSGTTGHSKGVMLTHKNIVSNALAALESITITEADRLLAILPLSHSYQCTCGFVAPFLAGSKIYFIKGLPTAQTLLPAVEVIKPTIILSVPLIMDKIYKKKVIAEINAKKFSKTLYSVPPMRRVVHKIAGKKLYKAFGGELRFMVFGGAATPPDVEAFLTEGGFPYITGYGLTETAPLLTVNPVGKVKQQSAGTVVPGVQLDILDPDPETGIGEIVAKGPNIMRGYYRNEEATKNTFTPDGWLITGDKGIIDEDGYLFIKGRSKNLIVGPSGENIYPEEIEFHLSQYPYVLESLVYEENKRIVARIYLDYDALEQEYHLSTLDGAEAQSIVQKLLEDIRLDVNSKVAAYSRIHRIIEQAEEFEKTPTKKIKRYLYIADEPTL
ncbi:AMP-binding protein [candidate division KSB1 bacterium]|nr:AMP-binding protein [candidate division KSB1 bacterium]